MGPAATAPIGLKRALHERFLRKIDRPPSVSLGRTLNANGRLSSVSMNRTLCYSPSSHFASFPQLSTRAPSMKFGLLPKFSTPVEKSVEIEGVLVTTPRKRPVSGLLSEAKVRRSRFEATLCGPGVVPAVPVQWR